MLITITKSPASTLGVKVGLFLPLRIAATWLATLPRGMSLASTKYHLRSIFDSLAINVFMVLTSYLFFSAERRNFTLTAFHCYRGIRFSLCRGLIGIQKRTHSHECPNILLHKKIYVKQFSVFIRVFWRFFHVFLLFRPQRAFMRRRQSNKSLPVFPRRSFSFFFRAAFLSVCL